MRFIVVWLLLLLACSGTKQDSGLGEPLRVQNGVFREGILPGVTTDAGAGLTITAVDTASTVLRPGQGEKTLSGRAAVGTVAIGIALGGAGTGWWLLPVDGPDPLNAGELGWNAILEIARNVLPGPNELRIVPIDATGKAGQQRALPVCIPRIVPDNLNACDPVANAPPAAIVSLTWDTAVDLDLVVVGPDGTVVDAKHPQGKTSADAGADAGAYPSIDRDSNGACALDLVNQEDLVFATAPSGTFLVYANLFSACGNAPVHFRLGVAYRTRGADGAYALTETVVKSGTLVALDANGGARLGTFVTSLAFP